MLTNEEKTAKAKYLWAGILCLIAWVLVAYAMYNELKDSGGVVYIINSANEGNYALIFLLTLSVILLACALHHIFFYLKTGASTEKICQK